MAVGPADLSYTQYGALPHVLNNSNDEAALRQAAQHFESLFIDMWMKSAREGTRALAPDSMFATPELQLHQEMADHETAMHLAQQGGVGLADVIVRQLKGEAVLAPQPVTATARSQAPGEASAAIATQRNGQRRAAFEDPSNFVATLQPLIQRLTAGTPLPALGVLSQAALETGWGSQVIADGAGESTHNLFGIKASADEDAPRVPIATREFEFGRWIERVEDFKAYADWPDSVKDYVEKLAGPRYGALMEGAADGAQSMLERVKGFAEGLQAAGYATDPAYASKVVGVARRIMAGAL